MFDYQRVPYFFTEEWRCLIEVLMVFSIFMVMFMGFGSSGIVSWWFWWFWRKEKAQSFWWWSEMIWGLELATKMWRIEAFRSNKHEDSTKHHGFNVEQRREFAKKKRDFNENIWGFTNQIRTGLAKMAMISTRMVMSRHRFPLPFCVLKISIPWERVQEVATICRRFVSNILDYPISEYQWTTPFLSLAPVGPKAWLAAAPMNSEANRHIPKPQYPNLQQTIGSEKGSCLGPLGSTTSRQVTQRSRHPISPCPRLRRVAQLWLHQIETSRFIETNRRIQKVPVWTSQGLVNVLIFHIYIWR